MVCFDSSSLFFLALLGLSLGDIMTFSFMLVILFFPPLVSSFQLLLRPSVEFARRPLASLRASFPRIEADSHSQARRRSRAAADFVAEPWLFPFILLFGPRTLDPSPGADRLSRHSFPDVSRLF